MKPALRVLILNLHLYGGLLGAPYLVIYGLSSLTYNHPNAAVFQSELRVSVQTVSIEPLAIEQPERAAAAGRDALGLIGFIPAWKTTRDEAGELSFHVNRPGRSYQVRLVESTGEATLKRTDSGVWSVLRGLHGMTHFPGSPWMTTWGAYTYFSIAMIVFAVGSGAALWWTRTRARAAALAVLALGLGAGLGLVTWMVG